MAGRTLVWDGSSDGGNFSDASNWQTEKGHTAKKAPSRHDTADLSGYGTIYGSGDVATLNIGSNGDFTLQNAAITAASVAINGGGLVLSTDTTLRAANIADMGYLSIASDLVPIGRALNIAVTGNEGFGTLALSGTVSLGGGSMLVDVGEGNAGGLSINGGTLLGSAASLQLGGSGGACQANLVNATIDIGGVFSAGVGTSAENTDGVQFAAQGGSITAKELVIGDGTTAILTLNQTNVTLGSMMGVGLSLFSLGGPASLTATSATIAVAGAVELTGGALNLGTASVLMTGRGVSIQQGPGGGNGTLALAVGDAWTDHGDVDVDGTLAIAETNTADVINGNLTIANASGGGIALLTMMDADLDVTGAVTMDVGLGNYPPSTIQDGGALDAASLDIGNYSSVEVGGAITGSPPTDITAGTITVSNHATFDLETTAVAAFGTSESSDAGTIAGFFDPFEAKVSVIGALAIGGPTDLVSSTLTVTARGTALSLQTGSVVEVQGSGSVIAANGGLNVETGAALSILDGAFVTASAASGDALTLQQGSSLSDLGTVTLTGDAMIAGTFALGGGVFSSSSTIDMTAAGTISGDGTVTGAIVNDGLITTASNSSSATLSFVGAITGSGTLALATGPLALLGSVGAQESAVFETSGTMTLGAAANFEAAISGWASGDALDLLHIAAVSDKVSGHVLTLYNGADQVVASLNFAQTITTKEFVLSQDGHGDTLITFGK